MADTAQVRDWWYLNHCTYGTPTNMFGRTPVYAQNTTWVRALEQAHFNAGYYPSPGGYIGSKRLCPAGIAGHPCQDDGDWCSLHNYGLAWDVEYNFNPHIREPVTNSMLWQLYKDGVTKYNPDIVQGILAVTNTHGEQLFSWLGYSIGDFMHWQINVPPERQDVDWTTIGGDTMSYREFRVAEFDLWTDENIISAFDRGRFESSNRDGFIAYWVTDRANRTPDEKARFMTDFYSSGSP